MRKLRKMVGRDALGRPPNPSVHGGSPELVPQVSLEPSLTHIRFAIATAPGVDLAERAKLLQRKFGRRLSLNRSKEAKDAIACSHAL